MVIILHVFAFLRYLFIFSIAVVSVNILIVKEEQCDWTKVITTYFSPRQTIITYKMTTQLQIQL